MDKFLLVEPLKEFYQLCLNKYKLGDQSVYTEQLNTSPAKFCFNPYFSTECDVQIKLAGVIEHFFRENNLQFSVNSEMKVYSLKVRNQRCDLTVHEIPGTFLYLDSDAAKQSLRALIEIKYANAVHPDYEFKKGAIESDLDKLSSVPGVLRYFVLIDEADRISRGNCEWLIKECSSRDIILFTTNSYINFELNYPYGHDLQFALTKQEQVSNQDYLFAEKEVFITKAKEHFQVMEMTPTYIEINIDNRTKADLYFSDEIDSDRDEIRGNCILDVRSAFEINPMKIAETFQAFASSLGARLISINETQNALT